VIQRKNTSEKLVVDDHPWIFERFSPEFSTFCEQEFNGRPCQKINLVHRVQYTDTLLSGLKNEFFTNSGRKDFLNMMKWKVLLGNGKARMEAWGNHLWGKRTLVQIQRIGEKNGVKRNLLVDEYGIPLSIVVCGANRHDSKMIQPLLEAKSIFPPDGTEEHLCLDAGYV
jgi:hypothetical protein